MAQWTVQYAASAGCYVQVNIQGFVIYKQNGKVCLEMMNTIEATNNPTMSFTVK